MPPPFPKLTATIAVWLGLAFTCVGVKMDLEARLSGGSGLVVEVGMGSSKQLVPLAITFGSSSIFLYDDAQCPPFIDCFDRAGSVSAAFGGRGTRSRIFDSIWLSPTGSATTQYFRVIDGIEYTPTSQFREAAGMLGLGPESPLIPAVGGIRVAPAFHSRRHMRLSLTSVPPPVDEFGEDCDVVSHSGGKWKVRGRLVVNEFKHSQLSVVVDLGVEKTLVSSNLMARMLGVIVREEKKLNRDKVPDQDENFDTFDCSLVQHLRVSAYSSESETRFIHLLGMSELLTEVGGGLCAFNADDSAALPANTVVVGSNLFASFQAIDLIHPIGDSPAKVSFHESLAYHAYAPEYRQMEPKWLVPRFGYPTVFSHDDGNAVQVVFPRIHDGSDADGVNQPSFILYNWESSSGVDHCDEVVYGGWSFVALDHGHRETKSEPTMWKVGPNHRSVYLIASIPVRTDKGDLIFGGVREHGQKHRRGRISARHMLVIETEGNDDAPNRISLTYLAPYNN